MASSYYPKIVTSGLVMYLDGANRVSYPGSGATWSDLSRNNNTCSLLGTYSYSALGGGSLLFNGSTGYGSVANSNSISTTSATVNTWVSYTAASGGGAVIIGKTDTSSSLNGFNVIIAGGQLTVQLKNATTAWSVSGPTVSTNTWYNVVTSFSSSGTLTLYVNGNLFGSSAITAALTTTTQPLRLADSVDAVWSILGGNIAIASMYNRVLTAAEVSQNFAAHRGRFGV